MNLYLIQQTDKVGYGTYDSAVVCCADENAARNWNPETGKPELNKPEDAVAWTADPTKVAVTWLGVANSSIAEGIVCASFNAG